MGRRDNQQQNTGVLGRRQKVTDTATLGRRERASVAVAPEDRPQPQSRGNFITRAPESFAALRRGEITPVDVAREIPGTIKRGAIKTADVVLPGITEFTRITGGS